MSPACPIFFWSSPDRSHFTRCWLRCSLSLPNGRSDGIVRVTSSGSMLPLEVTRTIPSERPIGKDKEHRSQHRVKWDLSGEDQKKIGHAGDMNATVKLVSYGEYCGIGSPGT